MSKNSKNIKLSVDGVLIKGRKILMLKRSIDPFKGFWVLPGGHVEYGETVEKALRREVMEETGIELDDIVLSDVYSDPKRDPRGHVVSCAYVSIVSEEDRIEINEESSEFNFFDIEELPEDIGFDHRKIISDAVDFFKNS